MNLRHWWLIFVYAFATCAAPGLHDHGKVRLGDSTTSSSLSDASSSHRDSAPANDLARHDDDCAACQLQVDHQVAPPPIALGLVQCLDIEPIAGHSPVVSEPLRRQPSRAPPLA
ncbi:hypothetical protein EP7_004861 [Isosphaeraceae bacterium EP7]